MKIGLYTPYLDTLTGGERYMLSIASCLSSDEANEVALFWKEPTILDEAKKRFDLNLDRISVVPNIFDKDFSLIDRLLVSRDYDSIIYLSDGSIPFLLAKKLIIHFQFPVEWVEPNLVTGLKKGLVFKYVCNSEYTKDYIDKKFSVESKIIYPPIALKKSAAKKKNIILTVGRFSKTAEGSDFKKIGFMIEAFKKLSERDEGKWKFVIVTNYFKEDEEFVSELRKKAKSHPIEILSDISSQELDELYGSAKIYWHAAGYGEDLARYPDRAEHFGISTIEAMSAGCIPVVFSAGGQKEILSEGENGFLWNSEQELLEKTNKLLHDEKLLLSLRSSPEKIEQRYGYKRFSREFKEIIL